MKVPFREHHLFQLLQLYQENALPLDIVMHKYFRSHRSLGSKDRKMIAETAVNMIRWQGLIDGLSSDAAWASRYQSFLTLQKNDFKGDFSHLPAHVRVSFPKNLFSRLIAQYGEDEATRIAHNSNQRAPLFIRTNQLKISRDRLLESLIEQGYPVSKTEMSEEGIIFEGHVHFSEMSEFQSGLFEVQDEGSQLLAFLVRAKPGDQVMDYCAGSGGKTLAFAPGMKGKGQIYLHDVRPGKLHEAKKRLKRAGIQNFQLTPPDHRHLKKQMDWVLVDAPCSGTGTLRRNPDMRWRFTDDLLEELVSKQRVIFEKALSLVKPGGSIVYGTCSLLAEENEKQAEHFLKTYPIEIQAPPLKTLPKPGEMDGFYGVVFNRQNR